MDIKATDETAADKRFLFDFERQNLKEGLDHLGHVRLTWLYLNRYEKDLAVAKICTGIRSYAESKDAKEKFHRTITTALVIIMAKRREKLVQCSWQDFLNINADIVEDYRAVLYQFYREDCLSSDLARTSWLEPDLKPF